MKERSQLQTDCGYFHEFLVMYVMKLEVGHPVEWRVAQKNSCRVSQEKREVSSCFRKVWLVLDDYGIWGPMGMTFGVFKGQGQRDLRSPHV